ncbi:hypothetical protein F4802DRAFT_42045 [Xylaria palmicola]|nr:hypothetical protein F4802DRAFT_42045 [Xylaria palmicola]
MGDPTRKLIDELCSLLDEATILSIASDYDLQKPEQFAEARAVLLTLSENVEAEEATGFNPSGFGGSGTVGISLTDENPAGEGASSKGGDIKSIDGTTTTTESSGWQSLSSGASSSKDISQEAFSTVQLGFLKDLTSEEKEDYLASMFISLKPIDIRMALQKANGDAESTIDELLSQELLEQAGQRPKGVEAFYVSDDDVPKRGKKRWRKTKKASRSGASGSLDTASTSEESGRDKTTDIDNIKFIAEHFGLSLTESADTYGRNNLSLGDTIVTILVNYLRLHQALPVGFPERQPMTHERNRVPWIPREYILPVFLTTVSDQAAREVIDVLAGYFEKPAYLKHDITYNLAASEDGLGSKGDGDDNGAWTHIPLSRTNSLSEPRRAPMPMTAPTAALQEARAKIVRWAEAEGNSRLAAAAAFRKGPANPLMRQVAAAYMERSREEAANRRAAASVEARLRVERQSTRDTIDLHGVSVHDGVAIAVDSAWRWWLALDPERRLRRSERNEARDGLKIVTGIGRHNVGGHSPLRSGVFKALASDGWRFEVLTGSFLLTGRI